MNNPLETLYELWNDEKDSANLSPELIDGLEELFKSLFRKLPRGDAPSLTDEYNDETVMTWGKFQGTALKDLPERYVEWLYNLGDDLKDKKMYKWLHGDKK